MEKRPITKMNVFERIYDDHKIDLGEAVDFGRYRDSDSGGIIRVVKCKIAPMTGSVNFWNTGRLDKHSNPIYEIQKCDLKGAEDPGGFTHLIDFSNPENLLIHRVGSPTSKPLIQPGEDLIKFNLTTTINNGGVKLGGKTLTTLVPSIRMRNSYKDVVGLNLGDLNSTYLLQYMPDFVVFVVMVSAIRTNYFMDNITHNLAWRCDMNDFIMREECGGNTEKIYASVYSLSRYEQPVQPT